jgi:hypothetical protein
MVRRHMRNEGYADIDIANTAVTIVSGDSKPRESYPRTAFSFEGTLEGNSIRARDDGTVPTASEGELIPVGARITLDRTEFLAMKYISTSTETAAVLKGHYGNLEANARP